MIPPQSDPLLPDVLALRDSLPLKPAPLTLAGRFVTLTPTDPDRDASALYHISDGRALDIGGKHIDAYDAEEQIWRYMFAGPFNAESEMHTHLCALVSLPNGLPFTVMDNATGHAVGMACYLNNAPADLKTELGSIWYSPLAQRTHANLEATHLLLTHAFALGYRRVEWKCNALNERSRRAALRMSFTYEGTQEWHMIVKGRSRDTAWFRVLRHEWPTVQAQQRALLDG
ncbi:MAG: GNAT family N-acetyltransferase [Anaerolineae bacterium]|nr:GNAT family N-acetyltransferase [Anaerolineae bacterium]